MGFTPFQQQCALRSAQPRTSLCSQGSRWGWHRDPAGAGTALQHARLKHRSLHRHRGQCWGGGFAAWGLGQLKSLLRTLLHGAGIWGISLLRASRYPAGCMCAHAGMMESQSSTPSGA